MRHLQIILTTTVVLFFYSLQSLADEDEAQKTFDLLKQLGELDELDIE